MTVKELIAQLKKLPQDLRVVIFESELYSYIDIENPEVITVFHNEDTGELCDEETEELCDGNFGSSASIKVVVLK